MMRLDSQNNLKLYNTTNPNAPVIVLDPGNARITVNGQAVSLGNGPWTTNGSNAIFGSGNVGIGTNDPQATLDADGSAAFGSGNATIDSSGNASFPHIWWGDATFGDFANTSSAGLILYKGDYSHPIFSVDEDGNFDFYRSDGTVKGVLTDHGLVLGSGYADTQSLYANTYANGTIIEGNVGIGTTVPRGKLDVHGSAYFSGAVIIQPQGDLSMGGFTAVGVATIVNDSFEIPHIGNGNLAYNPQTSGWVFAGSAGISGNKSAVSYFSSDAPEGSQVAFLRDTGSMS